MQFIRFKPSLTAHSFQKTNSQRKPKSCRFYNPHRCYSESPLAPQQSLYQFIQLKNYESALNLFKHPGENEVHWDSTTLRNILYISNVQQDSESGLSAFTALAKLGEIKNIHLYNDLISVPCFIQFTYSLYKPLRPDFKF